MELTQTRTEKALWYVAGFLAAIALALWLGPMIQKSYGSAPSGLSTTITDFNVVSVGPGVNGTVLTHTSANCTSRIISTGANAIMMKFSSSTVSNGVATASPKVSGNFGHLQLASTTVAYDGGIYGCGGIAAYGFDASSTIYYTELK